MLAFLDESGDPGRKILNGSSVFFVVALVTFNVQEDADACDRRISLLREELNLDPGFEFHFSKNAKRVRRAFLEAVTPYDFFYHVFALNKDPQKLYGPGFDHKESLYKFTTRLTFENAKPYLSNATVIIDGSGDRKFRDELATYLRARVNDQGGRQLIKKVKIQRSQGNNLLQLADYVAGVMNRFIMAKADGVELRQKFLALHQLTVNVWPK
jgi:hypothetical protein